eukprot:scaffold189091_cov56-Cyclotella_meneghiniana.AAC.1
MENTVRRRMDCCLSLSGGMRNWISWRGEESSRGCLAVDCQKERASFQREGALDSNSLNSLSIG